MSRVRRTIAALIVSVVAAAAFVLAAQPASAALRVNCDYLKFLRIDRDSNVYIHLPSKGSNNTNCVLGLNNNGIAVTVLQESLRYCHHFRLNVDGKFGVVTRNAVKSIQRRHGLTVDGVYGPKTLHWLRFPIFTHDGHLTDRCSA